jgi:hypothetical protein
MARIAGDTKLFVLFAHGGVANSKLGPAFAPRAKQCNINYAFYF